MNKAQDLTEVLVRASPRDGTGWYGLLGSEKIDASFNVNLKAQWLTNISWSRAKERRRVFRLRHFEVRKAPTRYLRFYKREKRIGAHLDFHVSRVGNLITHFNRMGYFCDRQILR